jgi:hypothetical protein
MTLRKFSFISPLSFLTALLAFMLTFTEISCNGKQIDTISGIELVRGYEQDFDITQSNNDVEKKVERSDPNIFALNAFIAGVLGLLLFLLKKMRNNYQLIAIVALIGFGCLIAMMINLQSEMTRAQNDSGGKVNIDLNIEVNMKIGFWLALASFFIAAVWNILMFREQRQEAKQLVDDIGVEV